MSGPITRPLETENDVAPSYAMSATEKSNLYAPIDNSVNKPMPWICLAIAAGFLALGLSASAMLEAQHAEREARMSEYYLLELDAKLIAAGIKKPDEAIAKRANK